MRALIQRVSQASVSVSGMCIARIDKGLSVFIGVGTDDTPQDAVALAEKIVKLRIFPDAAGKMNENIRQAHGAILSVSQFTLFASTARGNRPGFDAAAPAERAEKLWQACNDFFSAQGLVVAQGIFAAHMAVSLTNDGPVTLWLDTRQTAG